MSIVTDAKFGILAIKVHNLFQILLSEEGANVDEVLKEIDHVIEKAKEKIDTIILTPTDLGCESSLAKEWPMARQILDPVRLANWSDANTERLGCAVELIPAEAVQKIYRTHQSKLKGERVYIATKAIIKSDASHLYCLEWRQNGWLLTLKHAGPFLKYDSDTRFMFRLRKLPTSPTLES